MSRLPNRDVDALVQAEYEEALADGEPWAVESFDYRQGVVKPAVTPTEDDGLVSTQERGRGRDHFTGGACRNREHRPRWRVIQRHGNASAFNGYRWQVSAYSSVRCTEPACGAVWRTRAGYVEDLPDDENWPYR